VKLLENFFKFCFLMFVILCALPWPEITGFVRCQCKHASPTGKKCRRPILELVADPVPEGDTGGDLPEQPELLDLNDVLGAAFGTISHDINNDHLIPYCR
jgi:hypothetical protein